MKQALHIFRKDARRFAYQICALAALTYMWAWTNIAASRADLPANRYAGFCRRGPDRRLVVSGLAAHPRRAAHRRSTIRDHAAFLARQSRPLQAAVCAALLQGAAAAGELRFSGRRRLPAAH